MHAGRELGGGRCHAGMGGARQHWDLQAEPGQHWPLGWLARPHGLWVSNKPDAKLIRSCEDARFMLQFWLFWEGLAAGVAGLDFILPEHHKLWAGVIYVQVYK